MKFSGVYAIIHITSGKRYVGSAADLYDRWKGHQRMLRLNKHHSRHLESAWDKYSSVVFQFEILDLCPTEFILDLEQHYMDERAEYNISPTARNRLGSKSSKKTKHKMSKANERRWADPAHKQKGEEIIAALHSPAATEKLRATITAFWSEPKNRQRMLSRINSPSARAKRSAVMKKRMASPGEIEKLIASQRTPAAIANRLAARRARINKKENA